MTAKFDKFRDALVELCREHGVAIYGSDISIDVLDYDPIENPGKHVDNLVDMTDNPGGEDE